LACGKDKQTNRTNKQRGKPQKDKQGKIGKNI
jgi:hypothetical protein